MAGDSQDSVRDKCGDPQKVTQEDADSPVVWFYNFGPSEFVCYVSFANGILERIQVGGYAIKKCCWKIDGPGEKMWILIEAGASKYKGVIIMDRIIFNYLFCDHDKRILSNSGSICR